MITVLFHYGRYVGQFTHLPQSASWRYKKEPGNAAILLSRQKYSPWPNRIEATDPSRRNSKWQTGAGAPPCTGRQIKQWQRRLALIYSFACLNTLVSPTFS